MAATSRRTVLKALGAAPVPGLMFFGQTPSATASSSGSDRIPDGLKPGGELDRLIADLAAKDQFSGAVLLTHKKRPVLSRQYGMADKKKGVRIEPSTRFSLGSITKMFTAVAVHQLARQGKLHYDDKLGAHLDGFPEDIAKTVTIHHMLTHTSGLGDYYNLPGYREASMKWSSPDEVLNGTVDFIRKEDLAFPPGAGNTYSNSAYTLLGAIIAAVSKRSYYTYMKEHVFKGNSGFFTKPQWRADPTIAHPYHKQPEKPGRVDGLEEHAYIGLPPGGAFATCADLERFAQSLMNDDLLGAHTSLMLNAKVPAPVDESEPGMTFFGYGSLAHIDRDQWVHGHSGGSTLGTSANLDFFPTTGWVTVVLSNYDDNAARPIARLARDLILQR